MATLPLIMAICGAVMLLVGLFFLSGRSSMEASRARILGIVELMAGAFIIAAAFTINNNEREAAAFIPTPTSQEA